MTGSLASAELAAGGMPPSATIEVRQRTHVPSASAKIFLTEQADSLITADPPYAHTTISKKNSQK
jgi:hypothetical protein